MGGEGGKGRVLVSSKRKKKKSSGSGSGSIKCKGYKVPTPIQRKTMHLILSGSGKTATFLVPTLHLLNQHLPQGGVRVLIMSPTRDLALHTLSSSPKSLATSQTSEYCSAQSQSQLMLMDLRKDSDSSGIPVLIGTTRETEDVPRRAEPKAKLAEPTDSLVPITPEAVKENGDFPFHLQSPLTVVRKQLKQAGIAFEHDVTGTTKIASVVNHNDDDNDSPRTPKDGVFDPFAPGPDNMARAPQGKKHLDELRISVARRLDFDPSFDAFHDAESLSDQDIFESVYENLLQVIVSKQTEGALAQMPNVEYGSDDCKTPPSPLHFSGIFYTCPAAPVKVKPVGKPRNIQVGLCKKLEF